MIARQPISRTRQVDPCKLRGFTLFEVILAIALSTLLLMLIGMAINLYLTHMDARRRDVEFAQLARSVFAMIGDDLRAATEYKPQDMSGALAVASAAASDLSPVFSTSPSTGSTTPTSTSGTQSAAGTTSTGGTTSSTSTSSSTSGMSSTGGVEGTSLSTTPGVHGTLDELIIDASRTLRLDQLFSSYSGYSNVNPPSEETSAATASSPLRQSSRIAQSDLKTVRYFVRRGEAINPNSVAATSLTPEAQARAAGLVRQEIDRAERLAAEEMGDQGTLESGQRLVAPEVVQIEIRYFDGSEELDTWDMQTNGGLPPAVQVRLWIADPELVASGEVAASGALGNSREFRQTIYLPQARPATTGSSTAGTTGTTGTTGTSGSTSTTGAGSP
ncbi:MAG: hypothetical protein WD669_11540 [Pirellulales bacterium]